MTEVLSDNTEIETLATELTESVVATTEIEAVELALQGPPGPPGPIGPAGGAAIITRTTVAPIGGHRVMIQDADGTVSYADHTISAHADMSIGLTIEAAEAGTEIQIIVGGETIEPSWAWDVTRPIYLGSTGLMTQTPPASGFLQQVAIPLAADRIYWQPQPAVFLE